MLKHPEHIKGVIYAILMTLLSATALAAIKYLANNLSTELITFLQYVVCFCIGSAVIIKNSIKEKTILKQLIFINKPDRLMMFIRCSAGILGFYCLYISVSKIPLVEATLLRNSSPLFVPILAGFILHTHTNIIRWLIILVGFVGICFILFPQGSQTTEDTQVYFNWGYITGIASAFFLAISMILTNILGRKYSPQAILFYYYLLAVIGMLPLALQNWQWLSLHEILLVIYIGIAIHAALFLYTRAFTLAPPVILAPLTYLSIVHAGVIGYFFWGDMPVQTSIIGMIIVIISGIATTLYQPKPTQKALSD